MGFHIDEIEYKEAAAGLDFQFCLGYCLSRIPRRTTGGSITAAAKSGQATTRRNDPQTTSAKTEVTLNRRRM